MTGECKKKRTSKRTALNEQRLWWEVSNAWGTIAGLGWKRFSCIDRTGGDVGSAGRRAEARRQAELEIVDTPQWYAKVARKDYTVGFNLTGVSVDDPVENYSCKSERNYTQYGNAEVDKLLVAQSREIDQDKRRKIVWDIERILVEDAARPMITHGVSGNCWHSYVKGYTAHSNSIYNNTRFEDTWLDK